MSTAVSQNPGNELALAPMPPPGSPHQNTSRSDSRHSTPRMTKVKVVLTDEDREESPLPELKSSEMTVDRTKPLPTSLQSEFIPEDILNTLTQLPPSNQDQLGPPLRTKVITYRPTTKGTAAPANMWNFPARRKKFQHLTDQPKSLTGAGRDISFLYDVIPEPSKQPVDDPYDKSSSRALEKYRESVQGKKPGMSLPDTLIPEEYHVVKSKGVQGLEFNEDKFTTQLSDMDKNLRTFPSMKPVSRYEVVQLMETLDTMLEKSGIDDEEIEVKGPTQMHNLLELIKKEQNIYNLIFHELIRQVSVECVERGSLLAKIRERYNRLLDKVPRQVKSLHQEVMAQRALDRRLTEELLRFKTNISDLTNELSDVKEHDQLVTNQAQQAQENLKAALAESEKNAGLLTEYHELYELQRKRLETQVSSLTEERELWSHAAYSLALKVTDANSLASAKRLHMSEKGWSKLATHFTIVLGDKDTEQLSTLQGYVDKFRELIGDFHQQLLKSDEKSRVRLSQIKKGIQKWIEEFQREIIFPKELSQTHTPDTFSTSFRHSSMSGRPPDYSVMPPDRETIGKLFQDMRFWEETINKEVEKFGGDVLLSFEESMYHINKQMEGWTETALKVFSRHLSDDGTEFPAHEKMLVMNKLVENFMELFKVRVNGENGVAKGFITLANAMEPWDSRLNQIVNGGSLPPESEWGRLYDLFDDWIITVDDTFTLVGSTQKEEDRNANKEHKPITIEHIFRNTQTWLTTTINGVDNEDAKLVEQVRVLHAEIVHWMIQVLLRLAPDKADTPIEAIESSMAATSTTNDIKEKAESLFERLTNFSNYIIGCCSGIVAQEMQRKQELGMDDAEHEFRDLKKIKVECAEWIHTATILVQELLGGGSLELFKPLETEPPEKKYDESIAQTPEPPKSTEVVEETKEETPGVESQEEKEQPTEKIAADEKVNLSEMQVIGYDENVRPISLDEISSEKTKTVDVDKLLKADTSGDRSDTPNTTRAYEALAAVEILQTKLIETEERAQNAEEKVSELEDELKTALERLRAIDGKSVTPTIPENQTPSEDAKEAEVVKGKGKDKGKPPSTPTQMTVPEPSGAAKRPTSSTSVKSTGTPPRSPSQASHRSSASSRSSKVSKKSK